VPEDFEPILDYFEDTYVGRPVGRRRRRLEARFPPSVWNVNQRTLENLPQTNNAVEAWHHSFQMSAQASHPCIWRFIAHLQKEQGLQELNLTHVTAGNDVSKPLPKYTAVNKRIQSVLSQHGTIGVMNLLRGISYNQ